MAYVRKQLSPGVFDDARDLVRTDRLYIDRDGKKKATFSGACPEVVVDDGDLAEVPAHIVMKISKQNFERVIENRLGFELLVYMTSQEPPSGSVPNPQLIRWALNVCQKDVKFCLCYRVGDNPGVTAADSDWRSRKFYFQLYAKKKSPDIYLALTSKDSPTWKGFIATAAGPEAGTEKHKVNLLTQVYNGTINDLAKQGFTKTTWAKAKGE